MISTHTATCNKSEHQHLCNNTHHRDVSSTQVHTDNGCSRRAFNSSCGSNVCNTYCTSLAECVAQVHYVNDASETIGANTYKDVTTSGNCYRPPSKEMYLQPHIEPSIAPITGIEDTANSYIPPPSPAPNSDRYITGVMSPQSIHAHCLEKYTSYYDGGESGNREAGNFNIHQHSSHEQLHHQQHAAQSYSSSSTSISPLAAIGTGNFTEKYISSMQQCSSKPNSRFRMSDRFREVPAPKLLILNSPSDIVGSEDIYATTTDGPTAHPIRCVPSANFLTQHTPFVTRDTYTYLRSTVHTPVKRYIPTPPNQLPTDLTMQPSNQAQQMQKRCVSNGGSCTAVSVSNCKGQQTATQNINNVPNRIRLKCCKDGSTNTSRVQVANKNISHLVHNMDQRPLHAEYSASTARSCSGNSTDNNNTSYNGTSNSNGSINLKCTTLTGRDTSLIILHDQQFHNSSHLAINSHSKTSFLSSTSSIGVCSSPLSLPSLSLNESPVFAFANNNANIKRMIDSSRSSTTISGIHANNTNTETNNYLKRTPSFEYANTTVVNVTADGRNCSAPVTKMDRANCNNNSVSYSNITTANPSSSTTCMHCNTVRRTTGVHQTTQTTDPISPTPLQQKKDGGDTALTGIDVCNSNFIQTGLDETSFGRAPSTSDCISHSPSNGVGSGDNCGRTIFPNKIDDSSRSSIIIDQVQQQKQGEHIYVSSQKSQQQKKTIIRQSTITEKLEVVGSNLCSQSVSSECHLLQASPIQSSQQQRHSIQQRQQQQPLVKHQIHMLEIQQNQDKIKRCSSKKYFSIYIQKEISRFFGLDESTEAEQIVIWQGRQRRLALRRFGELKNESELHPEITNNRNLSEEGHHVYCYSTDDTISQQCNQGHHSSERPDILSTHQAEEGDLKNLEYSTNQSNVLFADFHLGSDVERKASVPAMIMSSITFLLRIFNKREQSRIHKHCPGRFTPTSTNNLRNSQGQEKFIEGIAAVQEIENPANPNRRINQVNNAIDIKIPQALTTQTNVKRDSGGSGIIRNNEVKIMEHHRQIYISERVHGWRTSAVVGTNTRTTTIMSEQAHAALHLQQPSNNSEISLEQTQGNIFSARTSSSDHVRDVAITPSQVNSQCTKGTRGNRISAELIDNVLDNSLHPVQRKVRLFSLNDVDDRDDHRPFFTYWINTVQILVLLLSVICYGIGPIGIGIEKKTGQVLVNSLSLQTVQHTEQRNIWVGPRNYDLVHLGAKLATCMRNDVRVLDVLLKIRRQERETACCIRNDDSGCVQSSQADCSLRGLFPAKSISTWKKWSAGESGPGGRISGSVCGLDPKYCDTPASVAPYEWPDDITKWPICRKTNSFSQRFRYKDHTAEHMVCEVIAHPCCHGVYGECRITTREYCDFVSGYFHEEASLCSQISCLKHICGMLPFVSVDTPDQFYRLFTSLCLHAGVLHLAITITFQHVFLSDLERLLGPVRTAILYIGSGLAGNLTSAILVPYKPEVGPLASLSGVIASFSVLLIRIHWKQLCKPHIALCKLICITAILFGIGTLPWQLNFAGLLAGAFCGMFLTVALVPFVSITEYGRKAKIKLIWSCVIFHLFIYSTLFLIFYLLPTELTGLNTAELVKAKLYTNPGSSGSGAGNVIVGVEVGTFGIESSHSSSRSDVPFRSFGNNKSRNIYGEEKKNQYFSMQKQRQYYYHHRYSEMMTGSARLLKGPLQSQQGYMATVHHDFHINLKNNPIGDKTKYSDGYADMNNNTYMSYYHKDGSVANNNRSKARDKSGGINKFSNEMESKCMDLTKNLVYIFEAIGGSNRSSNIKIGKYLIPGSKRTIENVFNDYNRNKNSYIKSVKNNDRNAKNNKINHKWSNTYNNNDKNSNNDNINNSNGNINNNNQSNIINKNKRNYNSTNKSNNSNSDVDIDILFN